MHNRIKFAIRSSNRLSFMAAVNDYLMRGYRIKKIVILRRWLFWYKYIAILKSDIIKIPSVDINIGPVSDKDG